MLVARPGYGGARPDSPIPESYARQGHRSHRAGALRAGVRGLPATQPGSPAPPRAVLASGVPRPTLRTRTPRLAGLALGALLVLPLSGCLGRSDALAPVIAITEPRSGATRNTDDLRISGYAMDDSGIASIRVDGADLLQNEIYASERGKGLVQFAFTKPNLTDGELTLLLEVTDVAGRTTTERYVLTLDATPPTVELTRVEPSSGGRVLVEGVARDNLRLSSIRINDVPLAFSPGAEFSFSVLVENVPGGEVVVEDGAGNVISRPLQ